MISVFLSDIAGWYDLPRPDLQLAESSSWGCCIKRRPLIPITVPASGWPAILALMVRPAMTSGVSPCSALLPLTSESSNETPPFCLRTPRALVTSIFLAGDEVHDRVSRRADTAGLPAW